MERLKLIGKELKAHRQKAGLSRGAMSEKIGLPTSTIQNIENGKNFSMKKMILLIDFFKKNKIEFMESYIIIS